MWKKIPNIQMHLWFVDFEGMSSQTCASQLEEIF